MSGELKQYDGPCVTNRRDEPYKGRRRLMVKRAARIQHPVISSLVAVVFVALGTLSALRSPVVDPYFTDAVRVYLLVALVSLGCGMFSKQEAVFKRSLLLPHVRYYVGMWLALSFAFTLFGLCFGNWIIRL